MIVTFSFIYSFNYTEDEPTSNIKIYEIMPEDIHKRFLVRAIRNTSCINTLLWLFSLEFDTEKIQAHLYGSGQGKGMPLDYLIGSKKPVNNKTIVWLPINRNKIFPLQFFKNERYIAQDTMIASKIF
jgi:hypothetical protein